MDLKDQFHRAMARSGGRFDATSVNTQSAGMYEGQRGRAEGFIGSARRGFPRLPPIHFDFADDPSVNACAFRYEGCYFIGVTNGALSALASLFRRMLADPRILLRVGDPDGEELGLPLLGPIGPDTRCFANGHGAGVPRDAARGLYAHLLWDMACDFLVAHEVSHIAYGHVDFLAAERGVPFLVEVGWAGDDPDSNLDRQTIETQADGAAACHALGTIRGKLRHDGGQPPPWDRFYGDAETPLFAWAFATSSLFRMLGDASFAGADLTSSGYPPARVRQMLVVEHAMTFIRDKWDAELAQQVWPVMCRALEEVEEAFSLISGDSPALEGAREAWGEPGKRHGEVLLNRWRSKVRSDLSRHAYADLPP